MMLATKSLAEIYGDESADEWVDTDEVTEETETLSVTSFAVDVPTPIPVPKPRKRGQGKAQIPQSCVGDFNLETFKDFIKHMPSTITIEGSVQSPRDIVIFRNDFRKEEKNKSICFEIPEGADLSVDHYFLRFVDLKDLDAEYPVPPFDTRRFAHYKKIVKMDANGGVIVHKKHLFVPGTRKIAMPRSRERHGTQISFPLSGTTRVFALFFVPISDGKYMYNQAIRTKHFSVKCNNNNPKKRQISVSRPVRGNCDERNKALENFNYLCNQHKKDTREINREIDLMSHQIKQIRDLFATVQLEVKENDNDNDSINIRYHTRPSLQAKRASF